MTLPPAPRSVEQAIAWGANQINNPTRQDWNGPTFDWLGACLSFVRQSAGCPKVYDDATQAWERAVHKHEWSDTPPRGAIVYWTGGHGHVVLSLGNGYCLSNDFLRRGRIDVCRIADITAHWGKPRGGWANDVNGYVVLPLDGDDPLGGGDPLEDDMTPEQAAQLDRVEALLARAVGPGQTDFPGTVGATLATAQAVYNAVRAVPGEVRPCTIVGTADGPERLLLANGGVVVIPADSIRVDLQTSGLAGDAVIVSGETYHLLRSAAA